MKLPVISLLLILLIFKEYSCAEETQKSIDAFLTHFGDELLKSTNAFLHEQRRLGKENLLGPLEKHVIDLELLVIELRKFTLIPGNEQSFHDLHGIEQRLFTVESLITEEILVIRHSDGHALTTQVPLTTVKPTTGPNAYIEEANKAIAQAIHFLEYYRGENYGTIEDRIKTLKKYIKQLQDTNLNSIYISSIEDQLQTHYNSLKHILEVLIPSNLPPASTVSPPTAKPFICTRFGLFRDVDNPRIYHHCFLDNKQLASSEYLCPPGESYTSENCHYLSKTVPSVTTVTLPVTTVTTPPPTTAHAHHVFTCTANGLFKDPDNTTIYHQCLLEGGHYRDYVYTCPHGQHFDQSMLHCITIN